MVCIVNIVLSLLCIIDIIMYSLMCALPNLSLIKDSAERPQYDKLQVSLCVCV